MLGTYACLHCGIEFERREKRNHTPKYCSSTCSAKHQYEGKCPTTSRKKRKCICGTCKIEFTNKNTVKYCSPECSKIGWAKIAGAKPKQPGKTFACTCANCRVNFKHLKHAVKYCSVACRYSEDKPKKEYFVDKGLYPGWGALDFGYDVNAFDPQVFPFGNVEFVHGLQA